MYFRYILYRSCFLFFLSFSGSEYINSSQKDHDSEESQKEHKQQDRLDEHI